MLKIGRYLAKSFDTNTTSTSGIAFSRVSKFRTFSHSNDIFGFSLFCRDTRTYCIIEIRFSKFLPGKKYERNQSYEGICIINFKIKKKKYEPSKCIQEKILISGKASWNSSQFGSCNCPLQ